MSALELFLLAACVALSALVVVFVVLWRGERKARRKSEQRDTLRRNMPGADLDALTLARLQAQAATVAVAFMLKTNGFPKASASLRARLGMLLGLWLQGLTLEKMAAALETSFSTISRLAKYLGEAGLLPNNADGRDALQRYAPIPPKEAGADPELCVFGIEAMHAGSMRGIWETFETGGGNGETEAN